MSTDVNHPLDDDRCPCGSGDTFGSCCGPLLRGERKAGTAEALMRSRYTAFATRDLEHALRSWHPRTRPQRSTLAQSMGEEGQMQWLRLEVRSVSGGGPFDDDGTVEFVAITRTAQGRRELHEISHFVREAGLWLYVRGDHGAMRGGR